MTAKVFAAGIFATVGILFAVLMAAVISTPERVDAITFLAGAAFMTFIVMLLLYMASSSNNKEL